MLTTSIMMEKQATSLYLKGILDRRNLELVWSQYQQYVHIDQIDVSGLIRVDSAGLALLVHLCLAYNAILSGVTPQLQTLIELYELEPVVLFKSKDE